MTEETKTLAKPDPLMAPGADGLYYKSPAARHELKFFIPAHRISSLVKTFEPRCGWDRGVVGAQEIVSLYYDTPDRKFFWDREESVAYRRKVRLRFYRSGNATTFITLEIKEKHKNLVVKKRVPLPAETIERCLNKDFSMSTLLSFLPDSAVKREVQYLHTFFNLVPAAWIIYERVAFVGLQDRSLRLTIDSDIRTVEPMIFPEKDSTRPVDLFGENRGIFEVKTASSIPLWVSSMACSFELSQSRASKYCAAIKKLVP